MSFALPDFISADELLDQQPDLLLMADLQGRVVFANLFSRQFWGLKARKLKDQAVWELLRSPQFNKELLIDLTRRLGSGDQLRLQMTARDKRHSLVTTMDVRIRPFLGEGDALLLISCRPVPLGLAEAAPALPDADDRDTPSNPKLREVFANLRDFYLRVDEGGAILVASPNLPPVLGVDSPQKLRRCSLRTFIDEQTWARLQGIMASAEGKCDDLELELRTLTGEVLLFSFSGSVWHHAAGWVGGIEGTLRDITQKKRWETALAESEARYRTLFSQANDAVMVLRGEEVVDLNREAVAMFGTTREQFIGKSIEMLSPALQPGYRQSNELIRQKFAMVASGESLRFDWRGRRFDGSLIDLEVSLSQVDVAGESCVQALIRDVTERLAVQLALKHSEQMYNTIVNNSGDGIAIVDLDRKVVFSNRQFQQMVGFDLKQIEGRDYLQFLDENNREEAVELFVNSFATGKDLRAEFWVRTNSDSRIRIEVNAVVTEHDEMPALVAFVRDITTQFEAVGALRKHRDTLADQVAKKTLSLSLALDEAETANRAKSRFLANMSHELRTPLHSVLSYAEFGESKSTEAERSQLQRYFNRIQASGKRLLRLLNDLLDLTLLESGSVNYRMEWCDIPQLVGKALDDMQLEIGERQVSVNTVTTGNPIRAYCDFERVAQVVTNLVSNALKFSDPSEAVTVVLSCDNQQQTMVMVEDKGVGLPDGGTESLFDPFVESVRTRTEAGGTGLGLAICKQIVDAHGGNIGGVNKPGGGASFYFTLPAVVPEE
ncbi:MAG: hypothetical protein DRQ60_00285 [Gammaproteobacteria bacterium]|nr:MAG: hypothetical protein DRQ52_05755 [Gammaproteobacteria bacterium]RLA18139.1 MAG: hypothetical protein DRQ60_00285 [Gammaproteobacteria bacterium]